MSSNKIIKNEEFIKNIDLEMKSNHNTNSDIISLDDDFQKKEIVSENCNSDRYIEIKFTKQNSTKEEEDNTENNINNDKENKELKENLEEKDKQKEVFGDLSSIIKSKIKTRNTKENNKNKKIRLLSASSALSTNEKKKKMNYNMNLTSRQNLHTYKNKNNIKQNSSVPKNKNIKTLKKPKKNPEIFVNKTEINSKNNNNSTVKKEETKKINFKEVLKRFDEEKEKAKKRFDIKKKQLKEKESLINTGKPEILKKIGNKYDKYSKDFLIRQKELNDNLNIKKKKLIEEENKKKENEYKKIIFESVITKKMKKYKKNKSTDEWVERLYKEDPKKRKIKRDYLQNAYLPTFHPYLPKKKLNNSVDKINQIGEVLDKYNEKQNPQLLIDYFSKNNTRFEDSENLFRQKIFNKFVNKNKKASNSKYTDINEDNNDESSDQID